MSKRESVLAVAILSGVVARWVSKHSINESGDLVAGKETFNGSGLIVDYAKLATAYSVPECDIVQTMKRLADRGFICISSVGGTVFAKPLIANFEKLYDALGVGTTHINGSHSAAEAKQKKHISTTLINGAAEPGKQTTSLHVFSTTKRNDTLFGSDAGEASGKSPVSEFTWFRDHFMQKYRDKRGIDYIFKSGRDGKAIKQLLRHFEIANFAALNQSKVSEIDSLIDFYLTEPSREYFTDGYSIHAMFNNLSALLIRTKGKKPGKRMNASHYNEDGTPKSVVSWA